MPTPPRGDDLAEHDRPGIVTHRCPLCRHIYGVMRGAGKVVCPWCRGEGLEADRITEKELKPDVR